jgi:hypothetical protein
MEMRSVRALRRNRDLVVPYCCLQRAIVNFIRRLGAISCGEASIYVNLHSTTKIFLYPHRNYQILEKFSFLLQENPYKIREKQDIAFVAPAFFTELFFLKKKYFHLSGLNAHAHIFYV